MHKNNVVLVLGAGASMPYGFPSGRSLKDSVKHLSTRPKHFLNSFHPGAFDEQVFNSFSYELQRSPFNSIDAFLEARPEYIGIGKHTIAYLLIKSEQPEVLWNGAVNDDDDWYRYVFHLLTMHGLAFFETNRLSIITYNYDRSFEFYFINGLISSFGLTFSDAERAFRSIDVFHVHGQLGKLAETIGGTDSRPYNIGGTDSRPYNQDTSPNNVAIAAAGIKIIHELQDDERFADIDYVQARQALSRAHTVFFLGFGYNQRNLERLLNTAFPLLQEKTMHGTTYGLTDAELSAMVFPVFRDRTVALANLGHRDSLSLEFIRKNVNILLRSVN